MYVERVNRSDRIGEGLHVAKVVHVDRFIFVTCTYEEGNKRKGPNLRTKVFALLYTQFVNLVWIADVVEVGRSAAVQPWLKFTVVWATRLGGKHPISLIILQLF